MKTKNDDALKALARIIGNGDQSKRNIKDEALVIQALEVQAICLSKTTKNDTQNDLSVQSDRQTVDVERKCQIIIDKIVDFITKTPQPESAGKTCKQNAENLTDDTQHVKETANSLDDGHDTLTIPMLLKQIEKLKQVEVVDLGKIREACWYDELQKYAGQTIKIKGQ